MKTILMLEEDELNQLKQVLSWYIIEAKMEHHRISKDTLKKTQQLYDTVLHPDKNVEEFCKRHPEVTVKMQRIKRLEKTDEK